MTSLVFTCPIDDLPMRTDVSTTDTMKIERDSKIGGHIHLGFDGPMTCSNGHEWTLEGDLVLQRTG